MVWFVVLGDSSDDLVDQYMTLRDEVLGILKLNLLKAQVGMKEVADRKRRDDHLSEGDWVFVKLKPYRQTSVQFGSNSSQIGSSLFWTFPVTEASRSGLQVAYKLELPSSARIHPVFHISVLKSCVGRPENQITPLQLLDT